MGLVFMHAVVSVDGFIADANDEVGPLFDWYFNGDAEIVDGGPFKVSAASLGYVRPMWERIGATVMGRHLFDLTNGWEGKPPAGEHIVVVTHRPKPDGWHPEARARSSTDVADAIAAAKELAPAIGTWPSPPATSAARRSRSGWSTRSRWTSCRWCSARASATSARSMRQHLLDDPDVVIQGERVLHLATAPGEPPPRRSCSTAPVAWRWIRRTPGTIADRRSRLVCRYYSPDPQMTLRRHQPDGETVLPAGVREPRLPGPSSGPGDVALDPSVRPGHPGRSVALTARSRPLGCAHGHLTAAERHPTRRTP